jgi:hypothetical protein
VDISRKENFIFVHPQPPISGSGFLEKKNNSFSLMCSWKGLETPSQGLQESDGCTVRPRRREKGGTVGFLPNGRVSEMGQNRNSLLTTSFAIGWRWKRQRTEFGLTEKPFIVSWLDKINLKSLYSPFIIECKLDTWRHCVKMWNMNYWHNKPLRVKLLKRFIRAFLTLKQEEFKKTAKYNQVNILI